MLGSSCHVIVYMSLLVSFASSSAMAAHTARLCLMLEHAVKLADKACQHLEECRSYVSDELTVTEGFSFVGVNDLTNAQHLLIRAHHDLKDHFEIIAQRLRDEQIKFMTEKHAEGSGLAPTHSRHVVRPQENVTALPQILDHEAATAKETASDGHSYAGTAVRGNLFRSQSTAPLPFES